MYKQKMHLNLTIPLKEISVKQYWFNTMFIMLWVSGVTMSLLLSYIIFTICEFKNCQELYFGFFGISGYLIVEGIMEIKESLKSDYDRQIKESLQKCGCVCLCPKCNGVLNHISNCSTELSGIIRYACPCGNESRWDFDLAPVPICIEESAEPLFKKD